MKRSKEEHLALIEETVEYYRNNPRAMKGDSDSETCSYLNEKGHMCAVGRCMANPKDYTELNNSFFNILENDFRLSGGGIEYTGVNEPAQEMFKEEYKNYNDGLWECLQVLHDSGRFWEVLSEDPYSAELSEVGRIEVKNIRKHYE